MPFSAGQALRQAQDSGEHHRLVVGVGSYHKVSVKHLDAYLDELEWRFNNRKNPYLFRDTMRQLVKAEHMEYKELTA